MKKNIFILSILALVVLALLAINYPNSFNTSLFRKGSLSSFDRDHRYKVITVHDGDTLDVAIGRKKETVRLIGVDTPEMKDPRKVVQCFGKEASQETHSLLDGAEVYLESDPIVGERDKYNRLLAYIYLVDGRSINKLLIEQGYAHEYTYNSTPYKYQNEFRAAEKTARDHQLGLWSVSTCGGNTKQPA